MGNSSLVSDRFAESFGVSVYDGVRDADHFTNGEYDAITIRDAVEIACGCGAGFPHSDAVDMQIVEGADAKCGNGRGSGQA